MACTNDECTSDKCTCDPCECTPTMRCECCTLADGE